MSKSKQLIFHPITNARKMHSFVFSWLIGRCLAFFQFFFVGFACYEFSFVLHFDCENESGFFSDISALCSLFCLQISHKMHQQHYFSTDGPIQNVTQLLEKAFKNNGIIDHLFDGDSCIVCIGSSVGYQWFGRTKH